MWLESKGLPGSLSTVHPGLQSSPNGAQLTSLIRTMGGMSSSSTVSKTTVDGQYNQTSEHHVVSMNSAPQISMSVTSLFGTLGFDEFRPFGPSLRE